MRRLQAIWNQYDGLFLQGEEKIALLNATAPGFFYLAESAFLECVVIGIARLVDNVKTGKNENLILEYLTDEIRPIDASLADALRDALLLTCKDLLDARRKVFAHRDREVVLQAMVMRAPKADIRHALAGINQMLSDVCAKISATKSSFSLALDPPGTHAELLRVLGASRAPSAK